MLYKRSKKPGAVWWVRFTIGGRETRVSSGTNSRPAAEEFERRLRDQVWRERELGEVIYTWEDAKARWLTEKAHKRSLERDREAFAALEGLLGGKALGDIDGPSLREAQRGLCDGRQPGTVNRIMAVAVSTLSAAVKWGWLIHAPKVESLPVEKRAPSWITQEQFELLWRELPTHAQQIVRFAVAVGARSRNVFNLRWRDVDLQAKVFRVDWSEFKGKRSVGFPLPPDALVVLEQQKGLHPEYVFTDQRGRAPVGSIKTCWKKACKRAGIEGLRVHDLRHTWAAWHKLAGTPVAAIKELAGWSDVRLVDRYGHINPQDYAAFADNRRTKDGTSGSGNDGK
jgi:integrase